MIGKNKDTHIHDSIEEIFRMFKVEPNDFEYLVDALEVFVQNERLDAEHEMVIKVMHKVDDIKAGK